MSRSSRSKVPRDQAGPYCLDSWAVMRWLEGGSPAATHVDEVWPTRPLMNWINVGEVFYVVARAAGEDVAASVVTDLRRMATLDEATPERVLQAASIKARHPMALGDAFAVATADHHDAVLLTGDPEILGAGGDWRVHDLR